MLCPERGVGAGPDTWQPYIFCSNSNGFLNGPPLLPFHHIVTIETKWQKGIASLMVIRNIVTIETCNSFAGVLQIGFDQYNALSNSSKLIYVFTVHKSFCDVMTLVETIKDIIVEQECIPVGCVPPAHSVGGDRWRSCPGGVM